MFSMTLIAPMGFKILHYNKKKTIRRKERWTTKDIFYLNNNALLVQLHGDQILGNIIILFVELGFVLLRILRIIFQLKTKSVVLTEIFEF